MHRPAADWEQQWLCWPSAILRATTLRMLFSSLSVCSAARILCTRNSLRLAGGTCCNNAHARRCCGSLRFGRKTYCGRFMPRFYGATRRPTHARIRPRSPCRPAGKSSYKGRLWDLGGGSPPMRRRPATRRGWRANRIPLPRIDSRCSVYLRPC